MATPTPTPCKMTSHSWPCPFSPTSNSFLPFDVDEYRKGSSQMSKGEGNFTVPNTYVIPKVQVLLNPHDTKSRAFNKPYVFSAIDLLMMDHVGNPAIIFGPPFCGKTSLFLRLIAKSKEKYGPQHWIRYIKMSELAATLGKFERRPKDFMELLAFHLKISSSSLKELFKPLPNVRELIQTKNHSKLARGDIYLDGFDEIPEETCEYFLRMLPQLKVHRTVCPIRIWISCRSYKKRVLLIAASDSTCYDILGFTRQVQIDMLSNHWKSLCSHLLKVSSDLEKLKSFAAKLYSTLEAEFGDDFHKTIGAVPFFMEIIASFYRNHLELHFKPPPVGNAQSCNGTSIPELLNAIFSAIIEFYGLKSESGKKSFSGECLRINKLYCKFAVETFPRYLCSTNLSSVGPSDEGAPGTTPATMVYSSKFTFTPVVAPKDTSASLPFRGPLKTYYGPSMVSVPDELFRVGLLVPFETKNGTMLGFHHKKLGDYFIAKCFSTASSLVLKTPFSDLFEAFYFRVLLFDEEARTTRGYLDCFLDGIKYYPIPLNKFLINHYKLRLEDQCEWEKIRDLGNVWHLLVIEGHHHIAQAMMTSFLVNNFVEELQQFLRMRVPIKAYEDPIHEAGLDSEFSQNRLASSLDVLAMFGYSGFVEETLSIYRQVFDMFEIKKIFNEEKAWTPLHYAAWHSNLWFISKIFLTDFNVKLANTGARPRRRKSDRESPLHLLLTYSLFHVVTIQDFICPEYDWGIPPLAPSTPNGTACGSSTTGSYSSTKAKGKAKGRGKKGGKSGSGKRPVPQKPIFPPPPALMTTCCWSPKDQPAKNHEHYRVINLYRRMTKNLKGGDKHAQNFLAVQHACINYFVNFGGEDIDVKENVNGNTILQMAAEEGHFDTVHLLLQLKADVHVKDNFGRSAIHYAGQKGHRNIFLLLIKYGAKAIDRDTSGLSAIRLWKTWGEHFDKVNQLQTPMTVGEMHFFKTCSDIDVLMDKILPKSDPDECHVKFLALEELNELLMKEKELEERMAMLKIEQNPINGQKNTGVPEGFGCLGEVGEEQLLDSDVPVPDAGQELVEQLVLALQAEEDEEEEFTVEGYCTEEVCESCGEPTDGDAVGGACSMVNGSESGAPLGNTEHEPIPKKYTVKVVRNGRCLNQGGQGRNQIIIEPAREAGRRPSLRVELGDELWAVNGPITREMLELQFVNKDGRILKPSSTIYEGVIAHLTKVIRIRKLCE